MFYRFHENDLIFNQIETHPEVDFWIYSKNIYYNGKISLAGKFKNPVMGGPGIIDLYENNVDRANYIYPFTTKNGSLTSFKTIDTQTFNNNYLYGDTITGSYPLTASISSDRFLANQTRKYISALKNTMERNRILSPRFEYQSTLHGDKSTQELRLISIPSIFYGSSIEKGSVSCKLFVTGILTAELVDDKRNGELRQKFPYNQYSGSVAGLAFYKEGFLMLTGSWDLHATNAEVYKVDEAPTTTLPRWIDFATTGSSTADTNVPNTAFRLTFRGTNYVPVVTMFAKAPKGELNYSNNPTFINYAQTASVSTGSFHFKENRFTTIKNIAKSNFVEPTGSFVKTVYISKIGIYDKDRNLIAIAKTSSPIRKKETEGVTFKLKMDF